LNQKVALLASILAFALTASAQALAQPVPPPYPGTVPPGFDGGLPPAEVNALVRSTGLRPLEVPIRRGPVYAMRAIDPDGQEVRVIVNARTGRISKVIPITVPRYALVPPSGRPPGRIAMVPDDYGPDARLGAAPGLDGPPPNGPGAPTGPVPIGSPQRDAAAQAAPPLPRPRPKVAATVPPATGGTPGPAPAEFDE
jgi:hypothetical protein